MNAEPQLTPMPPRQLKFRNHYRYYFSFFTVLTVSMACFWAWKVQTTGLQVTIANHLLELSLCCGLTLAFFVAHFLWLRSHFNQVIQVHQDHLTIQHKKHEVEVPFADIESVSVVCWSLFYLKMKNGVKHYFNSSIDRVDYIWEGVKIARPELISQEEFEKFRVDLIKYDHHQKRKEWFFQHRMVDVFNWLALPVLFIFLGYMIQSRDIVIHQPGLYLFRLFLYSFLILLTTNFIFSMLLKVFVFDRKIQSQLETEPQDKIRDLDYEEVVLRRTKLFQILTASFAFAVVIKTDINLYSITRLKGEVVYANLKQGKTIIVDNRYNCLSCKYPVAQGDMMVFGKGWVGQVVAKEGEMVDTKLPEDGRTVASQDVQEVPKGHLALKSASGKELVFIPISNLIGRIQK